MSNSDFVQWIQDLAKHIAKLKASCSETSYQISLPNEPEYKCEIKITICKKNRELLSDEPKEDQDEE